MNPTDPSPPPGDARWNLSTLRSEGREPGARRRKIAGYLRAANELRQTYQSSYGGGWNGEGGMEDGVEGGHPGHGAVVARAGERMVVFPSYARRHVRGREKREEGGGVEKQERESGKGEGDPQEEFWRQRWDQYEDNNAVVDVDVRGWIYSPQRGPLTRKQRLFVGLARQLVGLQAPTPEGQEGARSRGPSPGRGARTDEEIVRQEANAIMKKGEEEAKRADRGEYSESARRPEIKKHGGTESPREESRENVNAVQKREAWNQPAQMSKEELAIANENLMARLNPFMANPMQNLPVSAFFYNDDVSRQRTVYTDAAGHFALRAALDFIPTHVRILAGENLSATTGIRVIEPHGVSLISDIDDTIKHTAINSGAREIFRNAFIRDLCDLTIKGVREWYDRLFDMGVKFHYVSNSPWQLFPVLESFFANAGLPPGSFHLKRYSGMLQGIFEPVAERKKSSLDRIAQDFPERRFILVGDSGEADLEVYTDFVLENPGRVLAIFIRDITTTTSRGFFDPSVNNPTSSTGKPNSGSRNSWLASSNAAEDDDPHLRAAIQASLKDVEDEAASPNALPRRPSAPGAPQSTQVRNIGDLIDLSDPDPNEAQHRSSPGGLHRANTADLLWELSPTDQGKRNGRAPPPKPPAKPTKLRGASVTHETTPSPAQEFFPRKPLPPPPPKPRRLSSTGKTPPPTKLSVSKSPSKPAPPKQPRPTPPEQSHPDNQSYVSLAKQKLTTTYNHIPSLYPSGPPHSTTGSRTPPAPPPHSSSSTLSVHSSTSNPTIPHDPSPTHNPGQEAQQGNKREQLWRVRWARAEQTLRERGGGVVLRRWREGGDVVGECIKVVQRAAREER
ncbi:hypothetical protein P152DRAFT_404627 [Eremomyces bilateralis CBS 781.70]|uniref:Phosphatidate phosphatase APP1 catalytic domain-containing protein n=1 Tax=Eremomyces bilateralis CBS 781.70 TaxID=1392243 RepID=A0A6G1FT35_9PEZI|nr:uncharacterized protein P152DRAFT_404627 [Eremomyces bilateralis CBS 781.70]KAF1808896.1 hypothetical protein P152DRAFT_404627 [Eremomyces bilateralis CBS 781.70]